MRKICFLVSNLFSAGGIEKVVIKIADALIKTGKYEITICSISGNGHLVDISDKITIKRLSIKRSSKNLYDKAWQMAYCAFKALKFIGLDYLIITDMGLCPYLYVFFAFSKVRLCAWEHNNFYLGKYMGSGRRGRRFAAKHFYKVITITKEDQGFYKQYVKKDSIIQIYNPLIDSGNNICIEEIIKKKKIISCGTDFYRKGFDMIFPIASSIFQKEDFREWTWDVYGIEENEEVKRNIAFWGVEGKLRFLGKQESMERFYPEYEIFVFLSRSEGFGLVLIEAQNAGLPIVSFDCPCGPKELVQDGVNGYLVPCFDLEKMGNRIEELMANEEKRIYFSKHAGDMLDQFDIEKIVSKWEEMLDI